MKPILVLLLLNLASVLNLYSQDSLTTIYLENGEPRTIRHNNHWNCANYDTLIAFCHSEKIASEIEILGILKDSFNRLTISETGISKTYATEFVRLIDTTLYELEIVKKIKSLSYLHSQRFQYDITNGYFGDSGYLQIELTDTLISDSLRSILYVFKDCISNLFYNQTWKSQRDSLYRDIGESYKLWTTFSTKGLFQNPWESLINGWYYHPSIQSPPRNQFIILHPSVGVEFQNILQNPIKGVLSIDLLGSVHYSSNFTNYYYLSLASYFRNDVGAGIGVKIGWNKLSAGIAFHNIDGKSGPFNDAPFFFMSINLFNLSQSSVEEYDKYRKTLEKRLQNQ